eukprot:CAMPEP_0176042376 /NCGR_PEP_ID=MMETSP0120_2-20121206/21025_1 /TAXON_ID=160619 /ORGANISM="Kryptoperidinium foliaceum, Strain CCMP 1326" /LENGTH=589 /DNA_ID=CAMNT_0017375783 /DNA_START=92 /DNA_END=1861 /DNA_ORIENTATION=-
MAPVPVVVAFGVLLGSLPGSGASPAAVADDDECAAQGPGAEACSMNALQRRSLKVNTVSTGEAAGDDCADLDAAPNKDCEEVVRWAADSGKWDPHASEWFADMPSVCGVDRTQANENDFHRLYFCAPPGGKQCGKPPCQCSKPPCNVCNVVQRSPSSRPGCGANPDSIHCKPPAKPFDYKGMAWPTMTFNGGQIMHIFAIGDWGGMDGSLKPIEGRPELVAYTWGARAGPSVFPRTRWDLRHEVELCSHKQFLACFSSHGDGDDCPASCGYVKGVDDQPQQLVAKAMSDRARFSDPSFILNVGDNFYWGGIEKTCGTPMDQISYTAHHQFDQIFERMYNGQGLDKKPWLSVLGNHDWGGRQFNNGWDQQIAYTWASDRWVMPAPYWMVHVDYPMQLFSADFYFLDSNFNDAKNPPEDSEHNICGSAHNPPNADCSAIGGPESIETCPQYFQDLWQEQKVWAEKRLSESSATWQIAVTHFPCGEDGENQGWYRKLHQDLGLDLLVTGHRHDQELWLPDMEKNQMGGLTCIVTGGGGGITSEATPNPHDTKDWYGEAEYGFYDLTIMKYMMKIESINWDGKVVQSTWVHPK